MEKQESDKSEAVSAVKGIVRRIKCKIFGHNYYLLKELSSQSDLIKCERCNKMFAINYSVRCLLPWDRELEKFYKEFYELEITD